MKYLCNIVCAVLASLGVSCMGIDEKEIPTAKNVDPARYMGTWYEIARFENRFEKGLHSAKAKYELQADNTVLVTNSGVDKNGNRTSTQGRAYAPNPADFSKLRVTFFWPFYSDYYILELDSNYQVALVGGRDKKYLWILARTPTLTTEELAKILKKAESRGYDVNQFVYNSNLLKDEK